MQIDKDVLSGLFVTANERKAKGKKEEEALDEEEFITFYYSLLQRPGEEEKIGKFVKSVHKLHLDR
jgi:hypothetical protein